MPFLIGLAMLIRRGVQLSEREAFANEFADKLLSYIKSGGQDGVAYGWLVHRSNKMQIQLGSDGIMALYRPPYATQQYRNFPILLNILPELRRTFGDEVLSRGDLSHQYSMLLNETLTRHAGTLSDLREDLTRSIKNPIIWLREGVRALIALPLSLLGWLGVLSEMTISRMTGSKFFEGLSGLAAVVGFASAVMGIAVGWHEFVQLVTAWWRKFL